MSDVDLSATDLDLSAGDTPTGEATQKANELLNDAANRRKYRRWSFGLSVVVVLFLAYIIYRLMCAITTDIQFFSPWVVGIFATLVVAVTVVTLSLLRATFSPPENIDAKRDEPEMPQMTVLSEALKTMGTAFETLTKVISK